MIVNLNVNDGGSWPYDEFITALNEARGKLPSGAVVRIGGYRGSEI